MKALAQEFWQEEDGFQTIEMVLILIVMVGLVVVLKSYAGQWLTAINTTVSNMVKGLNVTPTPPGPLDLGP